jgi:hypothetical protein
MRANCASDAPPIQLRVSTQQSGAISTRLTVIPLRHSVILAVAARCAQVAHVSHLWERAVQLASPHKKQINAPAV